MAPTEDVDEQHGEEHRLDRHVGQLHRLPRDMHEVAACHRPDVGQPADQASPTTVGSEPRPMSGSTWSSSSPCSFQLVGCLASSDVLPRSPPTRSRRPSRPPPPSATRLVVVLFDVLAGQARRTRRRATAGAPRCCPPARPPRPAHARRPWPAPATRPRRRLSRRPSSFTCTCPATSGAMRRHRVRVRRRQRHVQASAPARLLQLQRRPVGDHLAVVHHHDAMRQLVGLLEILRRQQHGHALTEQLPDGLPHPLAATSGRDQSSARRGTGPAAGSSSRRPGPAAGACRPSSP